MDDYTIFKEKMKRKTGIDLSLYKEAQMKRRLYSLAKKHGSDNFITFFKEIERNPLLFESFLEKMTINVSSFFRNIQWWRTFEEKLLPELIGRNSRLKVWSAACSTGEEPYTIAMILSKYTSHFSILATDIDEQALVRADRGYYNESSLSEIPIPFKEKFFKKESPGYVVKNELKQSVRFRKHNLLLDPYEKNFDFISCRNVVIYFVEETKPKIYRKFYESLKPGGILFIGCTEQIFNPERFGFESPIPFFYIKK